MKRFAIYNIGLILFLSGVLMGCEAKSEYGWYDPDKKEERMIVTGCVINEDSIPLQGIRIDIPDVRENANEPYLPTYNYAITDSAGHYTIIRYMGREIPDSVRVVATPQDTIYKPQAIVAQKQALESIDQAGYEVAIKLVANFTLHK